MTSVDELASSLNNNKKVVEKPKTQLDLITDKLRSQFLKLTIELPSEYDPVDIERIQTDDSWLRRFILANKSKLKPSLRQLTEAMKWRKSFGASQKSWSDLPIELFTSGFESIDTKPIMKNQPIVVYLGFVADYPFPKCRSGLNFLRTVFFTGLELVDRQAGDCGLIAIVDFTETEFTMFTLEEIRFFLSNCWLLNHYPLLIKKILLLNLPWFLKPLVRIVKMIFPVEIHSVSNQQVFEFIDKEYVLKFIGGESEKEFNQPPGGCWKSIDDIGKENDLSDDEICYFKRKIEYIAKKLEVRGKVVKEKEDNEGNEFQINAKKSQCLE